MASFLTLSTWLFSLVTRRPFISAPCPWTEQLFSDDATVTASNFQWARVGPQVSYCKERVLSARSIYINSCQISLFLISVFRVQVGVRESSASFDTSAFSFVVVVGHSPYWSNWQLYEKSSRQSTSTNSVVLIYCREYNNAISHVGYGSLYSLFKGYEKCSFIHSN